MIELAATLRGEQPTYETAYVGMRVKCISGDYADSYKQLGRVGTIDMIQPGNGEDGYNCMVIFAATKEHGRCTWWICFKALEVIE